MIIIFTILVICYFYFLYDSYKDLTELKKDANEKTKYLAYLSFIGSLLIAISGLIFLYIALKDKKLDIEIAFN